MTKNAKPIILWDNLLCRADAQLSASSSDPDQPVANLADWREYLCWQAGNASAQEIILQLDSEIAAGFLAICNHNFYSAGVGPATLYGSNTASDWSELVAFTIADDKPLFRLFVPTPYKYYKLALGSGTAPAQAGLLFIGGGLEFPTWPASGFDPDRIETVIESGRSEEGYLLATVEKYSRRKISLHFSHLAPAWVEENFLPFWDSHIPKPFLLAWDCLNHPSEIFLLEMSDLKRETPWSNNFRSLSIEMEGRV
jgi:hypothetical protein